MQSKLLFAGRLLIVVMLWCRVSSVAAQDGAVSVPAEQLATAVTAASDGDTIIVSGGIHRGPLLIDKALTLIGQDWPVLDGQGEGTVLHIAAAGTTLQGFVIRNSGSSLDQENSGVAVEAPQVSIAGNRFEETLFGVYLREADGSIVRDNLIHSKDLEVPRRGDAIRVWYSSDVLIENNVVEKGRDVVLWYSERITVRGNEVSNGRYGLHFMYCDDALIEGNHCCTTLSAPSSCTAAASRCATTPLPPTADPAVMVSV